ncbi:Spx/MgsR family RNA polymerase-binding regulatory protein [Advenella sp. RU8]|uniref:Spx/MgsR family RNA polymerase-binding regulatory protein n=1 Tax=Advenella sp. RU8 TaxID=3399575 RepID=UPI003AAAE71B
MKTISIYGLKNCSTCTKAIKWLQAHDYEVEFIDYRANPIDADRLLQWASLVGGWEKLINRASMTWRNLPDERKSPASDEQWLAIAAEFPSAIKRPIAVRQDGQVFLGFSEKNYALQFK